MTRRLDAEAVRGALALAIVVGGLVLVGLAWVVRGGEDSARLASVLVGLIGLVLGYYFGARAEGEP